MTNFVLEPNPEPESESEMEPKSEPEIEPQPKVKVEPKPESDSDCVIQIISWSSRPRTQLKTTPPTLISSPNDNPNMYSVAYGLFNPYLPLSPPPSFPSA